MILEIHGAGFKNKGAELMLRAAVDELRHRLPDFEPAIDPWYGPYGARCELGLRQIFPMRKHVGVRHFYFRFLRQRLFALAGGQKLFKCISGGALGVYGGVSLSDVQGFIDISGFAYTDHWGPRPSKNLAEITSYYKNNGRPVILLPQAFGPFGTDEIGSAFRKVLDNASLVFARDTKSYEYAVELAVDSTKVLRAPDITLFYPKYLYESRQKYSNYVCVVPNVRMLDQGEEHWGAQYESYLIQIVQAVLRQGLQVRVVVHDSRGQDLRIAQSICAKLSASSVALVDERDPVALKRVIGQSLLVIGSRYHSLVAAFSMGVPAIALGWAHKYKLLLEDFGCGQFLISHDTSIETVLEYVNYLLDESTNIDFRNQISGRLEGMATDNQEMWKRVLRVLLSHSA